MLDDFREVTQKTPLERLRIAQEDPWASPSLEIRIVNLFYFVRPATFTTSILRLTWGLE